VNPHMALMKVPALQVPSMESPQLFPSKTKKNLTWNGMSGVPLDGSGPIKAL
jgi:hypothetical protein